jgi:hypothetical protein
MLELTERPYVCPVCSTRLSVGVDADTLVLLEGRGEYVEHVVTVDDMEVHRCRLPPHRPTRSTLPNPPES